MTDSEKIEQLLSQLQSEGRSSPAGQSWGKFHAFLSTHQSEKSGRPPMPLILAASGESNATKHSRLRDQLDWPQRKGCYLLLWRGWTVFRRRNGTHARLLIGARQVTAGIERTKWIYESLTPLLIALPD